MKLPCDRGPCAAMERILSLPAEQLKFLKSVFYARSVHHNPPTKCLNSRAADVIDGFPFLFAKPPHAITIHLSCWEPVVQNLP